MATKADEKRFVERAKQEKTAIAIQAFWTSAESLTRADAKQMFLAANEQLAVADRR